MAVDKVKPLKFEDSVSGTEFDMTPTEADPLEDYLTGKGFSFENLDTYLLEKVGGVLKCTSPSFSLKPTYTGDDITAYEVFNGFTQTTINRIARGDFTYTGDNITNESWKIYDTSDGTTVLRTINIDHTYTNEDLTNTEVSES